MSCSAIATRRRMPPRMPSARLPIILTRSNVSTTWSKRSASRVDRPDHAAETTAMTRKRRRIVLISAGVGVLAISVGLMLSALRDSIVFFNSPSDVVEKHVAAGTRMRLGGLVKADSLVRGDNLRIRFEVTDGVLDGAGVFNADTVLAKHDETYMPKEVAAALKKTGHWKDDYAKKAALPVGGGGK